ncbi:unannotated protein [freshwater metagenome]|uniref:Unannotated protein n=1 Tax=freshwater metagenome TaxID=449393 RepID=A0A6J6KJZ6_9ZZZZ|nr:hypothetical protein [Actinomycetota bacterium]
MKSRFSRLLGVALLATTVLVTQTSAAHATTPSPFDASFGSNGLASFEIPLQRSESMAKDIITGANGNFLVLYQAEGGNEYDTAIIGKYSSSGSPDTQFGINGRTAPLRIKGANFALQSNGKILLTGFEDINNERNIVVYRFTANGIIDATFSTRGSYKLPPFPGQDIFDQEILIDINNADGTIHLGFQMQTVSGGNATFFFVTLNSTGYVDEDWGINGAREVIPVPDGAPTWSALNAIKVLSDGSLLGIGAAWNGSGSRVLVLTKIDVDGYLDTTFDGASNGNGIVFIQFASESDAILTAALVLQNDHLVVAGVVGTYATGPWYYGIAKILSDGTADTSFGSNGFALSTLQAPVDQPSTKRLHVQSGGQYVFSINSGTTAGFMRVESNGTFSSSPNCSQCLWTGENDGARALSLTVQSDNKIVVAGSLRTQGDSVLRRFTASGSADGSFSNLSIEFRYEKWSSNAIGSKPQPDGSIITVGGAWVRRDWDEITRAAIFKFTATGAADTSFGLGGYQLLSPPTDDYSIDIVDFVIQPDGKTVVLGTGRDNNSTNQTIMMWRVNANGTLDNTFGTNGAIITSDGTYDLEPYSLLLTDNGKFIIPVTRFQNWVGASWTYRYTSSGQLDPSYTDAANFAGGVPIVIGDGEGSIHVGAHASNGSIYVAGDTNINSQSQTYVARILPNGSLDSSFSGGFKSWPTQSQTLPGYINRIHVDDQSRIVLLGTTQTQNVLARLDATGTFDTTLNGSGSLVFFYQDPAQIDDEDAEDLMPFNGGYIIVGGGDSNRPRMRDLNYSGIARTTLNGSLDQSFGTNGILLPFPQSETYFLDIAALPDGASLITGYVIENDEEKMLLVKIPSLTPTPIAPPTTTPPPASNPVVAIPPTTTPPPASNPVMAIPPTTTIPVVVSSVDEPIKLVVTVSQAVILKRAKVTVPKAGKVSLKSTTPKVCKVVKARVQAVNTGTCRISITVTTSAKKRSTKTLSFKVT